MKHVYYILPIKYDEAKIRISRDLFVKALNAEGIPFSAGYVKPLYFAPIYHENCPIIYKFYKKGRRNIIKVFALLLKPFMKKN